ncbi:Predicted amidohydrolase [Octadecabacter temperatus]|uniref:2-oxoglutaramate amidase n=1 Tax=Octadecabacter temperatus TaxID=1458307 RepID=A0A0K0Y9T7_9RHOB|nr:carbon-nitrogen hydrolase family protein [Octadecabacter temperatus]AKS47690.1 2-oxoglutaramate amidase [Octadecabacter temperatus]SIO39804.1 Predicted amidohydrolase [Octadecabacter temperatus]
MKAAVLQITSSDNPAENLELVERMIADAAAQGATLVCTPEVTNCVSMNRAHQSKVLNHQDEDPTLKGLRESAREHGVWLSIGSLALQGGADGRFVNRSFLINPSGEIAATYDKIHMFDVQVSETETYAESSGYAPGSRAVLADMGDAKIGLTICYDLRFPHLHRTLAKAGADIILAPSAFSAVTGAAHWETLLRARAIETGCFVIAAAQTGTHSTQSGKSRQTYGHSLVVSPWGEVLADAGSASGITLVDFDFNEVSKARKRIPALTHDRVISGP